MQMLHASRAPGPTIAALLGLFALASCGDTTTERAATGALGGAVIAGPAGALVGGAAGSVAD